MAGPSSRHRGVWSPRENAYFSLVYDGTEVLPRRGNLLTGGIIKALGGQSISSAYIRGAVVSGTATTAGGEALFEECEIGDVTLGQVHLRRCTLTGTFTISAATTYLFEDCHSEGSGDSIIDLGSSVGSTHLDMHGFIGELDFRNIGQSGTDVVILSGAGEVTLNANCTGGTLDIHGHWDITDNSATTTITDDANFNESQIIENQSHHTEL